MSDPSLGSLKKFRLRAQHYCALRPRSIERGGGPKFRGHGLAERIRCEHLNVRAIPEYVHHEFRFLCVGEPEKKAAVELQFAVLLWMPDLARHPPCPFLAEQQHGLL